MKAAGYRLEQTQTKTVGGKWKYRAEFKGEGKVPFLASASGEATIEKENSRENSIQTVKLELDLSDVNDIIAALKEIVFKKFIVLEDFHYLPTIETQISFAFALKVFHENSGLCFIIVGVWREKNRLIYYNGDLTNRVGSIDVDQWPRDNLKAVIEASERLLNVRFNDKTTIDLISDSFESVSILKEACFKICEQDSVNETQAICKEVGLSVDVNGLVKQIVNDQAGRYSAFVTYFSEGFQQT